MNSTQDFNFDTIIERRGGDSVKWNRYAGRDVLPMWVADMDFGAPPAVRAALHARIEADALGYAEPTAGLAQSVLTYLEREYGWRLGAETLVWLPGVVTGINLACRIAGGAVLTATPVYPPFLKAPALSGCELIAVPLALESGNWRWDFAALEAAVTPETRLLLLCHPHNPVGRAWQRDELEALADFCRRHDLLVCSDEIHCGLVLDAVPHLPFAALAADLGQRCVTLMAASKTWNIPGLGCAFAVIEDADLRRRFRLAMRGIVPDVNVLGFVATEAAYRDGEPWRQALLAVLRGNRDRVEAAIGAIPQLSMTHVEATFLAWIDVRELKVADPLRFFEAAGVGLSEGADFGAPGWLRLNFGCPRGRLEIALERITAACSAIPT